MLKIVAFCDVTPCSLVGGS